MKDKSIVGKRVRYPISDKDVAEHSEFLRGTGSVLDRPARKTMRELFDGLSRQSKVRKPGRPINHFSEPVKIRSVVDNALDSGRATFRRVYQGQANDKLQRVIVPMSRPPRPPQGAPITVGMIW